MIQQTPEQLNGPDLIFSCPTEYPSSHPCPLIFPTQTSFHFSSFPQIRNGTVGIHFEPGSWSSLVAQTVKCLSAMWETWVRSLGWEDPLKKEIATHSITLAWKIPWMDLQ